MQVPSQSAPGCAGRCQIGLHGWYFEEQVLFQTSLTPRRERDGSKLGRDDQQQEDDGAGEIEHQDTEKRGGRWDLIVILKV